jgi:hypothetical protein
VSATSEVSAPVVNAPVINAPPPGGTRTNGMAVFATNDPAAPTVNNQFAPCTAYFANFVTPIAPVVVELATAEYLDSFGGLFPIGVYTNASHGSSSKYAPFAHIDTRAGPRAVTAPLAEVPQIELSGHARLDGGRTEVAVDPAVGDMALHTDEHRCLIFVTPAEPCNGLAVVDRAPGRFTVQELAGGTSDAAFDWLLIARIPAELGSAAPHATPERIVVDPTPGS